MSLPEFTDDTENNSDLSKEKPAWVDESKIVKEYDAREDLESGIQPAAKVTKDILQLERDEIYLLITPFVPAQLLKIMEDKGFETYTEKVAEEEFKTFVKRK